MSLEGAVRQRLKVALRDAAEWRREHRRMRRRANTPPWLSTLLLAFWPTFAIVILDQRNGTDLAFAAAAAYAASTALLRARDLRSELSSGAEVGGFAALPVSDAWLVERAWRRFRRRSIVTTAPFAAAAWIALPDVSDPARIFAAIVSVVSGWVAVVGGTTAVAAFPTLRRFTWLGPILSIALLASIAFPERRIFVPSPAVWFALSLTPGGWAAQILRHAVHLGDMWALAWMVPTVALATRIPSLLRRLQDSYRVAEIAVSGGSHFAVLEAEIPSEPLEAPKDDGVESDPAISRLFEPAAPLAAPSEVAALLEETGARASGPSLGRRLQHLLTARERVVIEWLLASDIHWTVGGRRTAIVSAGLIAAGWLLPAWPWPVAAMLVVVSSSLRLAQWSGFQVLPVGGLGTPLVAAHPIGYREAARVMLKVTAVRLAARAPSLLALGTAFLPPDVGPWDVRLMTAARILALMFASLPLVVWLSFSSMTNDTSAARPLRSCLVLLVGVPLLVASVVFAILFVTRADAVGVLSGAAYAGLMFLAMTAYGAALDRASIDFLRDPAR